MSMQARFRTTVAVDRRGRTRVPIQFDPDQKWGPKPRHPVTGSVDGRAMRGVIEKDENGPLIALGPAWTCDPLQDGAEVDVVLDDDDRLLPEFIERQIEFLDQNPDCVAISCNASFITPEGEQTQQKWFSPTEPDAIYKTKADLAALYATKFLGFPSFVYRAPLAQDITFRQELGKVSDVGLIIDLAEFGSIAFQNKTLLEYRAHENQDSAYFPEKTIKELFDFLNSFLPDNKAMHRDMEKAYRDRLIETLMKNLLRGKSGLSEISWIIQVHRPKILFSLAIMLGMKIMKKILALTIAGMLIASSAGAGGSSSADQKWLQVVQKKLAAGQTHIATPAPERVTLLKQWAASNGYSIQVTRTATTYRIELAKSIAQQ